MKTLKNKLCSIALLITGIIPIFVDGNATILIFFTCIAIPLFFAKKNWIC